VRVLLAVTLLILASCVTGPSDVPEFVFPGRSTLEAAALAADASRIFAAAASCAGALQARPRGVQVRLYLAGSPWECPPGTGGCSYLSGSEVRIAALDWRAHGGESFGHEAVHLARWLVTGDSDAQHLGPWWVGGLACQVAAAEAL
jgi:hypothetical protein